MLSQVVSRVRRHFRRSQDRHQQPPDLRRWSDFMNPFPPVSPGGYRRYYAKHGIPEPKVPPTPASSPIEGPPSMNAPPSALTPAVPFPSQPSGHKRTRTRTLSTIPESVANSTTGTPKMRVHNLSNTSSLRRRRRRLLRTPSVERDFPVTAPIFASQEHDYISSNDSSHSHSSHADSLDTPPTTVEGAEEDHLSLLREEACPTPDDPYERSESRSSYCTARSDFSDV
ncbi:hypothetical protein BDZ94DRAFT_1248846 [Collybia nuda]|uniref:Uncharacterized protein n=1 Tax=Collybia nuda TaxID=64659 RepID=A0A9P6CP73_9AGAR|nr:hypothetical protein BDZ94DRAFT_1248846 [Collybia nuda]